MRRSPVLRFLLQLLGRYRQLGLLLVFGVAVPWGIFLKAASEIREGEGFPGDRSVLRWLHAHATPALDAVNLALTRVGGPCPWPAWRG